MQEPDNLNSDILIQGDNYEPTGEQSTEDVTPSSKLDRFADNPEFMKRLPIIIIGGIFIILILVGGYLYTAGSGEKASAGIDETPDFLKELEEGGYEFLYTQEEIEELRAHGYTGNEIEEFQSQQIFASDKIEEAKLLIQNRFNEEVAPMLDGASEQFKELERNTWVGGMKFDPPIAPEEWTYHQYELNADYERLPPRGNQLFIKIILGSGEPAFINIGPEIYYGLKDIGNIVVDITYTDVGTQKLITNITVIK